MNAKLGTMVMMCAGIKVYKDLAVFDGLDKFVQVKGGKLQNIAIEEVAL